MDKFVKVDDVKDLLNGLDSLPWEDEVEDMVDSMVTEDVAKVKHGYWIKNGKPYDYDIACSVCHEVQEYGLETEEELSRYHYCTNCGAKMDGGDN